MIEKRRDKKGKRKCKSPREKESEIQRNIDDGIVPYGSQLTVLALTKKYILQKKGVRESTRAGYKTVTNILEKEEFGAKRIDKVKLSDTVYYRVAENRSRNQSYTYAGRSCECFRCIETLEIKKNQAFTEVLAT